MIGTIMMMTMMVMTKMMMKTMILMKTLPTAPCSVSTATAESSPGALEELAIPDDEDDGTVILR